MREEPEASQAVTWNEPRAPWLDIPTRKRLRRLYFYSLFIDEKILIYRDEWWLRLLLRPIRRLSRWRVRHMEFRLPVLMFLHDLIRGRDY